MKAKQLLSVAVLAAFFAAAFFGGCAKKESTPESVFVAGLWWDTKNLDGYHTFDEANALAAAHGKRLPTFKEFGQLWQLFQRWDNNLKGRWFAENEADLGNPEKALFLPALGYRFYENGMQYRHGSSVDYWSGTQTENDHGYDRPYSCILYCDSSHSELNIWCDWENGCSVRCVAK